jgi:putative ABC transport system substrate-binding protein
MRRREFITLLGGAAAWPLAAQAQQFGRIRHVGALIGGPASDPITQGYANAFREGLAKLGWIEGRNLRLDLRFASGEPDRIRAIAGEMVRLQPEVIFVSTGTPTRAVQQATKTIPIVFAGPGSDPTNVSVQSIARPEGNITGFPILYPSVAGKWVELLKETDARITQVALVTNPEAQANRIAGAGFFDFIAAAASALGVKVISVPMVGGTEFEHAIDAFAAEPNWALVALPSTYTASRNSRQLMFLLAGKHRLPAIHWDKSYPAESGLMSFGSDFADLHRRAASYIDRILNGAKVSELPVQYPTKFDLVINLRAANAIGLTVPATLRARADEIIE